MYKRGGDRRLQNIKYKHLPQLCICCSTSSAKDDETKENKMGWEFKPLGCNGKGKCAPITGHEGPKGE